jgi:hypothetical protein
MMTAIVSFLGIIGRFAGDLLSAATGWAGTLMFGRVPQSHRRYLAAMMGGSVLWAILVLVFLVPSLAAWSLSTTPHPSFITGSWLNFVVTLGVILVPLGVGAAAYLAPADGKRADGVRGVLELARGYLLAPVIAGLLVFLAGVGIVRKSRSARHGWSDTHIPIVVPPDGYDDTVATLHDSLEAAGFPLRAEAASRVLSLPAWLLTHLAGPHVRRLRPDRLIELCGTDVRVGIYPSDVAVSATAELRTPIRATILAAVASADAHLTTSAEAQKVEDRLKEVMAEAPGSRPSGHEPSALAAIDRTLLSLDVPDEEWDVLYRLRLQAERDLLRRALGGMTAVASLHTEAPLPAAIVERADDGGARHEPHVAQVPAL